MKPLSQLIYEKDYRTVFNATLQKWYEMAMELESRRTRRATPVATMGRRLVIGDDFVLEIIETESPADAVNRASTPLRRTTSTAA